jgi:hypothetical protein
MLAFAVGQFDRQRDLVIDPTLVYSTYLGGSSNTSAYGIAVDSAGEAFVVGATESASFPTASPFQAALNGVQDAFVAKFNAAGSALVYSTYLGGSGSDIGHGIAVDSAGEAVITGDTMSADFPTASPVQATYGGGGYDVFVTKLNSAGSALVYSTYLGGSAIDNAEYVAVDSIGDAVVSGITLSTDFPVAPLMHPIQGANGGGSQDGFVTKLASGGSLVYSTYLGGTGADAVVGIAVDPAGEAFVSGLTTSTNFPIAAGCDAGCTPFQSAFAGGSGSGDAFVAKLNATGTALLYSTYLGGSSDDAALGLAIDGAGEAFVFGQTASTNFPTALPYQAANAGGIDAFVTKVNATGSALIYSTYLGGSSSEGGNIGGIAVDSAGEAFVAARTDSANFPVVSPLQATFAGNGDGFVTKFNAAGSELGYSTYLGGSSVDQATTIAVDSANNAFVAGYTSSIDFPTAAPFQLYQGGTNGSNAFVTKISALSVTVPATGGRYLALAALLLATCGCVASARRRPSAARDVS